MMKSVRIICMALLVLTSSATFAKAESPALLGSFGNWKAYAYKEATGQVCFMSSTPTKAEGKYTKRGKIYAMIAHRPGEKSKDVFSYMTGYSFNTSSDIIVTIDSEKFALAGQGENAWTTSDATDQKLALAIQKGSRMTVEGTSARGTKTKDTFSLKGSGDAYAAISKACGL